MDNFDLRKYLGSKTLLKENAPGYDTRKFGEALPTLESVQAAYEDKEFTPDLEKDDLQRKAIQQMMAKEKKKSGKGRAGVRSAAEKLGMKPSHVKEGVWNLPTEDEVIEFVAHVEDMKDKFYHIGSDDVFNGLDQAIIAAKDLAMNSTYVEDPSNPLGEPGSLNEFEVGDKVTMKGGGDEMKITKARRMFGSKTQAYTVKKANGDTAEYDETQLTKI